MSHQTLRVAVFPGAANAPSWLGSQKGYFEEAGIHLELIEVRSSEEQLDIWASGGCHAMQTSPDHLLRQPRPRDPVVVRNDGFGELAVYADRADRLDSINWALDDPASGFAFVVKALLEDRCGVSVESQSHVEVGGTRQRFTELMDPDSVVGGAGLHPPFDVLAERAGKTRLAGHLELFPELMTLATIVPRESLGDEVINDYLRIMDDSVSEILTGGSSVLSGVLQEAGVPDEVVDAAASGMLGSGGFGTAREPRLEGLRVVASLRGRYCPDWDPPVDLEGFIA